MITAHINNMGSAIDAWGQQNGVTAVAPSKSGVPTNSAISAWAKQVDVPTKLPVDTSKLAANQPDQFHKWVQLKVFFSLLEMFFHRLM